MRPPDWDKLIGNLGGTVDRATGSLLTKKNTSPDDIWRQRSQKLLADMELAKAGVREEGRRKADGAFAGDVEVLGVSTGKLYILYSSQAFHSFSLGLGLTLFGGDRSNGLQLEFPVGD
jgi:hypothetical protein